MVNHPNRSKANQEWAELKQFCRENPDHYFSKAFKARLIWHKIGFNSDPLTAEIKKEWRAFKKIEREIAFGNQAVI